MDKVKTFPATELSLFIDFYYNTIAYDFPNLDEKSRVKLLERIFFRVLNDKVREEYKRKATEYNCRMMDRYCLEDFTIKEKIINKPKRKILDCFYPFLCEHVKKLVEERPIFIENEPGMYESAFLLKKSYDSDRKSPMLESISWIKTSFGERSLL
jgi:hypothetical protein